MSQKALHKKNGLKLGIIASCILMSFLLSHAADSDKVSEIGILAVYKNKQKSASSKPDSSKDVKQIQTLLTLLKFNPGPIDGIVGKKTTKAIRAFQLDIGVPVTGKIDKNLKTQLDRAYRMVVIRKDEQKPDTEEKPPTIKEKPLATAPQEVKRSSDSERGIEIKTGKGPELKKLKNTKDGPQQERTSNDHDLEKENQYIKYIKISFPIAAIIFFAFFYRIWTRSHEKKRDENRLPKADFEAERPEQPKPEEEYEELLEDHEFEKEMTDNQESLAGLNQQEPIDYQDPSHPGFITPVVRRKVWIRNKGQCSACGSRKDLLYDYVLPISEGGDNTLDNLQLLCKTCSQEKSVK